MKKPELLMTAGSLEELDRYISAGADAVNIGRQKFGLRLPGDFSTEHLREAVRMAHQRNVKVYVPVNTIIDNELVDELPAYLQELQAVGADAVVFGDPAVVMAMRQAGVSLPLHWSTEMTSTNYATANYWASKGAVRVVLARELNMEEAAETKKHVKMEVQVQIHGMTNIYHSKRRLLESYREHRKTSGKKLDLEAFGPDRQLYLIEQERKEERFPIFEDESGTHIMSSDDLCMIENLPELFEAGIDSLKIEGQLKPVHYNETVVRAYREAIDAYFKDPQNYEFNPEWLERIQNLQDPYRELSYGFFYKEQVY
jgi:putative protease